MKAPNIDELVVLPEALAIQRHFDAKNYRSFRWLLGWNLFAMLPGIVASLSKGWFVSLGFYLAGLLVTMALVALRQTHFFETWFRQVLLAYLFLCVLLLKVLSLHADDSGGRLPGFFFAAFLFLVFRLRFTEKLMLYGSLWVAAILPLNAQGWPSGAAFPALGEVAALTTTIGVCLVISFVLSQLEKRRFLTVWRREHSRARERERMREEIDTARRIQLSMLPQALPSDLRWLDVAAASLPATEVGGDYYDYFRLAPHQIALVIGDVAGHGLASGLLLSGVRSCLYLLERELAAPVEVLQRLNPMVRRTTDRRTYVTLLCAVLEKDGTGGQLTVASAGHPPALRWCASTRQLDTVGEGAPPLGTFLDAHYQAVSRPLHPGDLLIFYTDGLLEARNAAGVEYGEARLQRSVTRQAGAASSREVRDAILGDLSNFKGDVEQIDDITVVVVRMR
jgi:serine phosphatase RsbU (regulator of sigma subunit)